MTGPTLPITLASAAALGAINLWLGRRIVRMRLRDEVLIGDGATTSVRGAGESTATWSNTPRWSSTCLP